MKTLHIFLLTGLAAVVAAGGPAIGLSAASAEASGSAQRPSGGPLQTLPHGTYQCALPGDAGSVAYQVVEAENFRISTASRYQNAQGSGTYILRGDALTFTSGPKRGEQFRQIGNVQLRKLSNDGAETNLRCTRLGSR